MTHIALVAPSYPIPADHLAKIKVYYESLGYTLTIPETLIQPDLFCANTDAGRLEHLIHALEDPTVDIIWIVAGGYGMTRLMRALEHRLPPIRPKLFIGFSDATAFHLFLNQVWQWPSLHGPTARQVALSTHGATPQPFGMVGEQTVKAMLHCLEKGPHTLRTPMLTPMNAAAKEHRKIKASVVGGNLSLLQCSIGTYWQVQSQGKLVLLEDVDERGYSVDRMLTHLVDVGIFKGAQGILLGDFTGGKEADGSSYVPAVLERFAAQHAVPVFRIANVGHGEENMPLLLNVPLTFSVGHLAEAEAIG